jgi:D-threo-aldose 1-dehydrogenase
MTGSGGDVPQRDPAARVPLGKTRLTVTRLGLGTAPLGNLFEAVEDAQARAVVERAWELGLRLFDTAPLYGHGLAERRLGQALRPRPRDEFALATKVGRLLRPDAPPDASQFYRGEPFFKNVPPVNPVFDFSYNGVLRSVEESLERLNLDRVDILHIHDPDRHYEAALAGAYPVLDRLRREGVIAAVSAGMNQWQMLARFAREADFDCFLLAGRYTLLDQTALRELLPLCLEKRIAIIAGGVYNSGILAGVRPGAHFNYIPASPAILARAQRLDAICRRHGVPLRAAAIQFPLAHPAVAAVVIGVRSTEQLEDSVAMFRQEIPATLWEEMKGEGLLPAAVPVPAGK